MFYFFTHFVLNYKVLIILNVKWFSVRILKGKKFFQKKLKGKKKKEKGKWGKSGREINVKRSTGAASVGYKYNNLDDASEFRC